MGGLGRSAALAGLIIVALMIAGTIPVEADDAWLWALLALFAVSLVSFGPGPPRRRD
ncbi:MAG TPA: hypothetical protein VFT91_02885 [Dehalococcoidia bacterium]|nr:hypothetical protein [Dehalococcoidia bacterium]